LRITGDTIEPTLGTNITVPDAMGINVGSNRVGQIGAGYGGFTGNVIQVQSTTKSDVFTTSSTTYVDVTGFSCNITPKYNTSKILLLIDIGAFTCIGGGSSIMRLLRDSTEIYSGNGSEGVLNQIHDGGASSGEHYFGSFHHGSSYLDSPSTISQITYKIQIKSAGAYTSVFNRNAYDSGTYGGRTASSIILMEIQQ
jgi:hypothetical protein